jgi:coenzyme PQQ synthesis protein D (PqqD)
LRFESFSQNRSGRPRLQAIDAAAMMDPNQQEAARLTQGKRLSPTAAVFRATIQDQVSCDLAGETVILNLKSGMYYGLDPVGTRIWNLIQEPRSVHDILGILLQEYDVEPERCEQDLLSLLQELAEEGVIEAKDETGS